MAELQLLLVNGTDNLLLQAFGLDLLLAASTVPDTDMRADNNPSGWAMDIGRSFWLADTQPVA